MGFRRATALIATLALMAQPAWAQAPGWHYSPLPGEGDRASMGCARASGPKSFTCLVVRCEDDYSVGVHVHSSRSEGDVGSWSMTLDREDRVIAAVPDAAPYGALLRDEDGWLLDGLRHGTFLYLRHGDDSADGFAYIDLAGSFRAIQEALYWCAPRVGAGEQNEPPGVEPRTNNGE